MLKVCLTTYETPCILLYYWPYQRTCIFARKFCSFHYSFLPSKHESKFPAFQKNGFFRLLQYSISHAIKCLFSQAPQPACRKWTNPSFLLVRSSLRVIKDVSTLARRSWSSNCSAEFSTRSFASSRLAFCFVLNKKMFFSLILLHGLSQSHKIAVLILSSSFSSSFFIESAFLPHLRNLPTSAFVKEFRRSKSSFKAVASSIK